MQTITKRVIKKFRDYLYEEEKSKNTIEKYIRDLLAFNAWLSGRALKKTAVIEYKQQLIENYAPKSVNSMLSSLNSFFEYFDRNDCRVKTLKIQQQIFAEEEKELTKKDYEKLLFTAKNNGNNQLYLLMQTLGSTGIRISELRYITVKSVKMHKAIINCKGKMRVVMLPKQLCRLLKEYISKNKISEGSIFVSKHGNPLDRSNVWKMLKALCKSAGVCASKVFPHNFRHLFARTFYSLQKDIVRLADVLGHSSINTTRVYTMETGDRHMLMLQRLGLLMC